MSEWREDLGDELPRMSLGELADSPLEVRFQDEGSLTDTRNGEALEVAVTVLDTPTGYTDMNDKAVETDKDYYIMSSSSRFMRELAQFGETLTGSKAKISASGDGFERTYRVDD